MQKVLLHVDDDPGWRTILAELINDFVGADIQVMPAATVQEGIAQFHKLYAESDAGRILFTGIVLDLYLDQECRTTTVRIYETIIRTDPQMANKVVVCSTNNAQDVARAFTGENVACPLTIISKWEVQSLIAFMNNLIAALET